MEGNSQLFNKKLLFRIQILLRNNDAFRSNLLALKNSLNLTSRGRHTKISMTQLLVFNTFFNLILILSYSFTGELSRFGMSCKRTWTTQEDYYLRNLIPDEGKIDWNKIAVLINAEFPDRSRAAKQCRARFINHAKFLETDSQLSKWKIQDIDLLCQAFEKYGASWTRIAEFIPGKSENSCKNKFYGTLRKVVRKINKIIQVESNKKKKLLKNESVIRVIEAPETFHGLATDLKEQSTFLRQQIFNMVKGTTCQLPNNEIVEIYARINKFNLISRSFKSKKSKIHSDLWLKPEQAEDEGESLKQLSINEYTDDGVQKTQLSMKLMNIFDEAEIEQLEQEYYSQFMQPASIENFDQPSLKTLQASQDLKFPENLLVDNPCSSFPNIFSIEDSMIEKQDFFEEL